MDHMEFGNFLDFLKSKRNLGEQQQSNEQNLLFIFLSIK